MLQSCRRGFFFFFFVACKCASKDLNFQSRKKALVYLPIPVLAKFHPFSTLQFTKNTSNFKPPHTHLRIQILTPSYSIFSPSSASATSSTSSHQLDPIVHIQNEPKSRKRSTLSRPHKRSLMSQIPSTLSHSPTLQSFHQTPHHHTSSVLKAESLHHSCLYSTSLKVLLATKAILSKFIRHSCRAQCIHVHLRFLVLLSLSSLCFYASFSHHFFFPHFLFLLAFFSVLVISFCLALPRFPSIRLLLARSLRIKPNSSATSSQSDPQVAWQIGSEPRLEGGPLSGSWVQVYSNGDVYEGEFHKGKCSGSGVYYYHMSGRYEGDWVDGKYDGYGVETWAKGSRYRGQYRQGFRHGIGVYRFHTGDVYAGDWCNGQCHGCGVYTGEDGSRYVGELKWGVKHGLGQHYFRNGDTYSGEYFADKMHGFGIYRFGNGHQYEGAWHEGRMQGLGRYSFRSGETQSGHWQNGFLNVSSTQDTVSGPPHILVNHSKVLNAVQEAHRAAEEAVGMGTMEERIKKAIAAANKAANVARVAAVKAVQNQMHQKPSNTDHVPIPIF